VQACSLWLSLLPGCHEVSTFSITFTTWYSSLPQTQSNGFSWPWTRASENISQDKFMSGNLSQWQKTHTLLYIVSCPVSSSFIFWLIFLLCHMYPDIHSPPYLSSRRKMGKSRWFLPTEVIERGDNGLGLGNGVLNTQSLNKIVYIHIAFWNFIQVNMSCAFIFQTMVC
jgi:hypothetical protein